MANQKQNQSLNGLKSKSTRSSADADKHARRHVNRVGQCAAELLRIFYFQKGGPPPSWISYFRNFCEKFKFAPKSLSSCKIWWRSDDARPSYCVFSIFKMAAVRHLGFSYFHNFCEKFKFLPISLSLCKIWWRSDDPWPNYCVFSIFKMAAVRHLGFGVTS